MIVLNEEAFLARALSNVHAHVDEMLIVDGGSSDRTVWIAETFGATVLHKPWNEDFSEQRNFGLDRATCDWILVMDADELFDEPLLASVRTLAANNIGIDAFAFTRLNYVDDVLTVERPNLQIRLFANDGRIRFTRKLHEYATGYSFLAVPPGRYIIHRKSSARQARQNAYYQMLEARHGQASTR